MGTMPIIKSKTTEYEFSLEEIRTILAEYLEVSASDVEVDYIIEKVGAEYDFEGFKEVTRVQVTVDRNK